jgi:AraC-like DNA-binding protein
MLRLHGRCIKAKRSRRQTITRAVPPRDTLAVGGPCRMSSTKDLIVALKAELKAANITYADLAEHLKMAESSIKRMFSQADMPLSRIDEVLRVLRMDFADLARRIADAQPLRSRCAVSWGSSRSRRWSATPNCC